MNSKALHKLAGAILSQQIETGQHDIIPLERMREALTTGPDLSEPERSLLLLSPLARDDWNRIRYSIANELSDRFREQKLDSELMPLAAAANDETGRIVLPGADFTVTLYRQDDQEAPWVILVQLGAAFRDAIFPMTRLRLVDSGGLEWLRGLPDADGEFTAEWQDISIDLSLRARQYRLSLEPV